MCEDGLGVKVRVLGIKLEFVSVCVCVCVCVWSWGFVEDTPAVLVARHHQLGGLESGMKSG